MILIATSFPVGTCLASLTLAKFPFPIVLSSLYLPMWGSSRSRRDDSRLDDMRRDELMLFSLPSGMTSTRGFSCARRGGCCSRLAVVVAVLGMGAVEAFSFSGGGV
uniref:Uncharacterized protein n=1 Tax=Cacopsylla melanoneura TaxID=428564 RepID=A0A8D8M7K7_9HEMI